MPAADLASRGFLNRVADAKNSVMTRLEVLTRQTKLNDLYAILGRRYSQRVLFSPLEPMSFEGYATDLTGAQMRDLGFKVANALRVLPFMQRNTRVVVAKSNHPDYFFYLHSTVAAGGIPTSVNAGTGWRFIADIRDVTKADAIITDAASMLKGVDSPELKRLLDSSVQFLLTDPLIDGVLERWPRAKNITHFKPLIDAAPTTEPPRRQLAADTPIAMFHTSGTTGTPKLCVWDGRNTTQIWRALTTGPCTNESRAFWGIPCSHAIFFGLQTGFLLNGVRTFLPSKFDPVEWLNALGDYRITHYAGFPYTYMRMAAEPLEKYDLRSMKLWIAAADKAHAAHIAKFVQHGAVKLPFGKRGSFYLDNYGSTEIGAGGVFALTPPGGQPIPCNAGTPLPTQFRMKIVDKNWNEVPRGEVGRILIDGRTHSNSYWNDHDRWAEFRIDGWWWAGDVGYIDDKGRLMFLDREVDSVKTREGILYTIPVEERLLQHARVMEATVFQKGRDADGVGSAVAYVVPIGYLKESDATMLDFDLTALEAELLSYANEGRSGPRLSELRVLPLESIPFGVTGKVLKRVLRNQATAEPVSKPKHSAAAEPAASERGLLP